MSLILSFSFSMVDDDLVSSAAIAAADVEDIVDRFAPFVFQKVGLSFHNKRSERVVVCLCLCLVSPQVESVQES